MNHARNLKNKKRFTRLVALQIAAGLLLLSVWQNPLVAASAASPASEGAIVSAVDSVGLTVSDMDRSVEFFTKVLSFETVSDREVFGREVEQLQGVFGLRMRVVRLRLGDEFIELT